MDTQIDLEPPILDTIPPPEVVRARLGRALRDVDLLRRLLRLAEQAAKARRISRACITRQP
jgi:hypothetical protein